MKIKLLAIINIITLLTFSTFLEFSDGASGKWIVLVSFTIFIVSGVSSVFSRPIWRSAHVDFKTQPKEFFIDTIRWLPSLCVTVVVTISILADLIEGSYDWSSFTSYLIVYLTLTFPCHLTIFKNQYQVI